MRRGSWIALPTVAVVAASSWLLLGAGHAQAHGNAAAAVLKDAKGAAVGKVSFTTVDGVTWVTAELTKGAAAAGFHGFHVHANNVAANGEGCVADPAGASKDWFVSADGHLAKEGQTHGMHTGDMPSLQAQSDGTARGQFMTRAFTVSDVVGKAVILHAKADNFGNVPVGSEAEQYTPGSGAVAKTAATGNAGDRIACGVVEGHGSSH